MASEYFDPKAASGHWYIRWRTAVQLAKDNGNADAYQFAAVIANAGYVINMALESRKESDKT